MKSLLLALLLAAAVPAALGSQSIDSVWTIRGGTFDGTPVRVDRALPTSRGSRFWRSPGRTRGQLVGWNPSRLPAAVAFRAGAGMSETDSTAFWAILRQLETDMGMRLFEPASLGSGDDPSDVIVVDAKPMPSHDGMTLITWTNVGSLYDARVYFRSKATLHDARVVTHEMMHALGFGHTVAWRSVMNPSLTFTPRLTVEDVAYAQLAFASRGQTERAEMWTRLALAADREPRIEALPYCEPFTVEQDPSCR